MASPTTVTTVTVCGGGNGAHAAAAYIGSKPGFKVNVFTRNPTKWSKSVSIITKGSSWETKGTIVGSLNKVSDKPEEVVPEADVLLIGAPANAHIHILTAIAPWTKRDAMVGTIFAQGGFDWAARKAYGDKLKELHCIFGLFNIPWLCRTIEYGSSVRLIGPKKSLSVAFEPMEVAVDVLEMMEMLFDIKAEPLQNFLTLTLTPSNQIIHPARYFAIFKDWDGSRVYKKEEIPWGLYNQFDSLSASWLKKLDDDLQSIKRGFQEKCPEIDLSHVLPIKERIEKQYGDDIKDKSSLMSVFRTNLGYDGCVTPAQAVEGGFIPAVKSRLFWEDIPYGLCILKSMAEMLDVETPSVDFMIEWHQKFMDKEYVKNGRLVKESLQETGVPQAYGINSLEDLRRVATDLFAS